ncbi:MAG: YceI family protein [Algoriphagus aquaeductus]|uniref:YceI family protein n=1 Tax=Algoriphagus aquaeductus TaxID=475299 RepID=UPI00391B6F0E
MRLLLVALFSFFLSVPAGFQSDFPVRFQIKNAGITVEGHFSESSFDVQFNPKDLSNSYLKGKVLPSSINTGISLRDKHLQGRQYFQSATYPEVQMHSKRIRSLGKNQYEGVFEIQIKDFRQDKTISFSAIPKGKGYEFEAKFSINRLDFGIGEKSLVLGDEVVVEIKFRKE